MPDMMGTDASTGSDRSSYWIGDRKSGKVLFIVRHHDALVRTRDGGDDHVEIAARLAGLSPFRHQLRPDQSGLFVESRMRLANSAQGPPGSENHLSSAARFRPLGFSRP